MLYAGLDLSRKRLDFHLLDVEGATVEVGALAPAPGTPSLEPEAARPRRPAHARQALPSLRSVRCARPPTPGQLRAARALAGHDRGQPAPDRRARPRDRRL